MAIHVTIDPVPSQDGLTTKQLAEALLLLKPVTIEVDCAGPGRVVLASLQAQGLPARALEKRPRPTLPEVQRIEELSKELEQAKAKLETQDLELRLLREHQRHLHTLIERLD